MFITYKGRTWGHVCKVWLHSLYGSGVGVFIVCFVCLNSKSSTIAAVAEAIVGEAQTIQQR